MAVQCFSYVLFFYFLQRINSHSVVVKLPKIHEKDFNMRSHFNYTIVLEVCKNRNICSSNDSNICATRIFDNSNQYKDFRNICYLFLSNMCDNPGEEFSIIQSGSCENYLSSRRNEGKEASDNRSEEDTTIYNSNETDEQMLRGKKKPRRNRTKLYEVDTAYDYHPCPLSCPDVYSPVCVNVNRGQGKYFKIMNFVNHCASDIYYCKNWREFAPPPYQGEDVRSSPLSWSFCGSSRYLQFARFAEVTSSLGHYGWLAGDQRYAHIMEPHERAPGYG